LPDASLRFSQTLKYFPEAFSIAAGPKRTSWLILITSRNSNQIGRIGIILVAGIILCSSASNAFAHLFSPKMYVSISEMISSSLPYHDFSKLTPFDCFQQD
jgi:hypothetical protein